MLRGLQWGGGIRCKRLNGERLALSGEAADRRQTKGASVVVISRVQVGDIAPKIIRFKLLRVIVECGNERGIMENETESSEKVQIQAQGEELDAIKDMLKIKIDGDWDEDMIGAAFDSLEALLCGAATEEEASRPKRPVPQRRRRRR
jgi:hypothetical protein